MLLEEVRCLLIKALKNLHDDEKLLLWNLYQDTIDGKQKIYKVNVHDFMSKNYCQSTIGDDLYRRNRDTGKKNLIRLRLWRERHRCLSDWLEKSLEPVQSVNG